MVKSTTYFIITPCKNEGKNLPNLIESVASQTVRPAVWVIVDDGSTDDSPEILKKATKVYDWIHIIRMNSKERDLGLHLAGVIKEGFGFAISYCKEKGLEYNFLGNLDGDMILPPDFFENLINEFERDPTLGVASGGTKHIIGDHIVHAVSKKSKNEPSGGHMLIRRECFEECGGIPLTYALDSVIKAKARLKGWKTRRFEENVATEIRDASSAEGYWRGFVHKGNASYYLNHNPLHVAIKFLKYSLRKPHYAGIAYLTGYFDSLFRGKERINDPEIRRYFWNKWREYL